MEPDKFERYEELKRAAASGRIDPNAAIAEMQRIQAGGKTPELPIVIPMYLAKLSDDDLVGLVALASRIRRRSTKLASWLEAAVKGECERRESLDSDEPIEAMYPEAQSWLTWTGAELGNALQAITVASYSTQRNRAAKFIDRMVVLMTAIVRSKLLKGG